MSFRFRRFDNLCGHLGHPKRNSACSQMAQQVLSFFTEIRLGNLYPGQVIFRIMRQPNVSSKDGICRKEMELWHSGWRL